MKPISPNNPCLDLGKLYGDLLDPKVPAERKTALVREAGKACLHFFCDFFLDYEDIDNPFHAEFISRIEEERDKDLFLLPRGHLKTSLFTIGGALWSIIRDPNRRIGIGSDTLGRAKGFLREIKLLAETRQSLQVYYPNVFYREPANQSPKWTDDELLFKRIRTVKEASITAFGLEALPTGDHYEDIRLDDIVTPETTTTRDLLDKTHHAFALLSPVLEPKGAMLRVAGTRYDFGDEYAKLQQNPAWRTYVKDAEGDGSPIFPQKFSMQRLGELAIELGPYLYSCQYRLSPVDPKTAMFQRRWIQYFTDWKPGPYRSYVTIDMAYAEKKTSDFTVLMLTKVDQWKNLFVDDYIRDHINIGEMIKALFNMIEHVPTLRAVGLELQPGETEKNSAICTLIRDEMRKRGRFFLLKPMRPLTDKVTRASALVPHFSNGMVFIRHNHHELEDELLRFPKAEHDDLVDALAWVPHIWREATPVQQVEPRIDDERIGY